MGKGRVVVTNNSCCNLRVGFKGMSLIDAAVESAGAALASDLVSDAKQDVSLMGSGPETVLSVCFKTSGRQVSHAKRLRHLARVFPSHY